MEQISEEVIARNEQFRAEAGDFAIWQFVTRGRGRWAHRAGPPTVCVCVRSLGFARFARRLVMRAFTKQVNFVNNVP